LRRIKARLIGREGLARELIERLANVEISIYGKTISIIGNATNLNVARHAVINLLQGSKHGNVYSYLEKQRKIRESKN